jgi:hypothetical protein
LKQAGYVFRPGLGEKIAWKAQNSPKSGDSKASWKHAPLAQRASALQSQRPGSRLMRSALTVKLIDD